MKKTFFYHDEVHDDFAATNGKIGRDKVDGSYRYVRKSVWWKAISFFVYRIIVTPIVWVWVKVWLFLSVKNRKAVRSLKTGCFLYLNHTQDVCDAFIPTLSVFPKKTYVITGAEAVSIPGIRLLVAMLGAVPLPSNVKAARNFFEKLNDAMREKAAVTVFPEAHIWPYCNFVRSFPDTSFSYPYRLDVPAVAGVVVYKKRKIFKNAHPRAEVFLSDPIFPDRSLGEKAARKKMRDEAFAFMSDTAKKQESFAYIDYIRK